MTKRPVNPYVAGAPLRGGVGFFGRRDTIEWVNRELRNPATNALVLFGQRRIGKTSLLLQLQRELPVSEFLPVYFDLQDQTQRALGVVLADLADTLAERLGIAVLAPKDFDDQGHFFERDFLPQAYGALGDSRRLLFLFDEFDVMDQVAEAELPDTAAAKALRPFLRRLMTADPRPAFVFVMGRRAEDLSVDFMATFKSSLVHEMWVLQPENAEALVRQAEVNGSLRFTEGGVTRILSLTNDHPYLTQLLCQRIWQRAYAANPVTPPVIDVQEVETATADALEAGEQALIWLWNGLSPAEKIYAAALAEVAEEGQTIPEDGIIQVLTAHAARLRTREVELAPRDLVKRRVLETAGEREYRFAVELFRRWVRLNKPVRDVKDELDRIEPVADRLYEIGHDYFSRRQWDNAVRFFRDALTAYPRHFRARLYVGETLMEQGHIDEAVGELQQAYELDRDEARLPLARALVVQAEAREKAGDEGGALTASEKALEVSPNEQAAQALLTVIWTRRSKAALEAHKFEDALHAYHKAGTLANFADDALQVVGGLGEEEQLRAYDLILRTVPDHAEARQRRQTISLRRGEAALERRDLEAALAAFQEAGDAEKIARVKALQERQAFATLVGEAEAHERAERWTEAAAAYEQLTAQAPDEESRQTWQAALERCRGESELAGLFLTGVGALAQQDWKQAQHAFAEVIRHRPDYRKNGRLAASLLEQAVIERKGPLSKRRPLIIAALTVIIIAGLTIVAIQARAAWRSSQVALAEAYFDIGDIYRNQGDFSAAILRFNRAIELEPDNPEHYFLRAWTYREAYRQQVAIEIPSGFQNALEAAIADFDQAIQFRPNEANWFWERAITYRDMGDLKAALADHNRSIELNPNDARSYVERATTYREAYRQQIDIEIPSGFQNFMEAAIADFSRAIKMAPDDSWYHLERAITYREMGDLEAALADHTRAIELEPDNPSHYFERAWTYRDAHWRRLFSESLPNSQVVLEAALNDFSQAITLGPADPNPYHERASTYREIGDLEAAIADHNLAIELNPEDPNFYLNRAMTYREAQRRQVAIEIPTGFQNVMEAAIADFNEAIQRSPDQPYYLLERAVTYREMGNLEAALADHNRALELAPDDPGYYYFERGVTYRDKGDQEAAIADFNQAIQMRSDDPYWFFLRAVTYQEKGDLETAPIGLDQAIELNPEYPYAYYFRAEFYRHWLNQPDQAVRDYEKFLELVDRSNCPECEGVEQYIQEQQTP